MSSFETFLKEPSITTIMIFRIFFILKTAYIPHYLDSNRSNNQFIKSLECHHMSLLSLK